MRVYDTPGVYYERRDTSGGGVNTLRSDIAAFVGIAERGPVGLPVPIESWKQFQAHFGGFTGSGYLAYVVRAFFENGGRRCWVVRVGSEVTAAASLRVRDKSGLNGWRIEASSAGVWGNDLEVRLRERRRSQTRGELTPTSRDFLSVQSTAGLARNDLVELRQGANVEHLVVANVEQSARRVSFVDAAVHPRPWFRSVPGTIQAGLEIRIDSIAYTLELREAGTLVRVYDELSVVPGHRRHAPGFLPSLLEQLHASMPGESPGDAQLHSDTPFAGGRFPLPPLPEPLSILALDPVAAAADFPRPLDLPAAPNGRGFRAPLRGGADGLAALRYQDFLGESFEPNDTDADTQRKRRGLAALEQVPEIGLVAIPDINIDPRDVRFAEPPAPCVPDPCLPAPNLPTTATARSVGDLPPRFSDGEVLIVQRALVESCDRRADRVALLDPPLSAVRDPRLGIDSVQRWRQNFDSSYAALYFPWTDVVDPLRLQRAPTLRIPPCGHVAGQIAEWDRRSGVHRAPANSALNWIQDVLVPRGRHPARRA